MRLSHPLRTVVAVLLLFLVCATAPAAASSVPTVAFFDINGSRILSTTGVGPSPSFGWRSLFSSTFDPAPATSMTTLSFTTAAKVDGTVYADFLTVPYCVDASGNAAECDLRGHILYLQFRFRRHEERRFQAIIWQDVSPTSATTRALAAFRATLNRTDVVYPSGSSATRMEDSATCADFTDECYLSSEATYTGSYKELDPSEFSARFLFRIGEKYSLDSPCRVRLQHSLPHDSEAEVEVVIVLAPLPSFNPLNPRWWIECITGRLALMVISTVATFGFLAATKETSAVLARRRTTTDHPPVGATLYDEDGADGNFVFLQNVAAVASDGLQRAVLRCATRGRQLMTRLCSCACCRAWLLQRRRQLPTSDDQAGEAGHEIMVLDGSGTGGDAAPPESAAATQTATGVAPAEEQGEEESGPMCRICRCAEPTVELFAPCACNGSSKLVHHRCLEQWREMTSNPEHRRVCAECKTPYILTRVVVPQNPNLLTGSPVIEPVIRHYAMQALSIVVTVCFAVGGAYGLKFIFFVATGLDAHVAWSCMDGYHWVLTVYFLLALALNLNIMYYCVKDMASPQLQLLFVLLSLLFLEIPISYGMSAFLSVFFGRLFTWEVSYGVGLCSTGLLHVMDAFTNFYRVLDSFAEEREVVAPRPRTEGEERNV